MNSRQYIVTTRANCNSAGFSLVELLAVVAIMAIMASLLAPAISGFSSTAGRRGAVNLVMNTIDQARVAALEQGRDVHVIFGIREFPEPGAIMVLRETETGVEPLTRWVDLPKGVTFAQSYILSQPPTDKAEDFLSDTGTASEFQAVGVLQFSPRGTVKHPNGNSNNRRIEIAEAARHNADPSDASYGFDVISVARYTGRPQLDVSIQNTTL